MAAPQRRDKTRAALTSAGGERISQSGPGWSVFPEGRLLRVSKLTDYAVVVLSRLEAEGGVQTAPGLAMGTGVAEPTVAKVLKMLAQSGLVEGLRGARGGYRLVRPLGEVPLSEVIVAIDGPIALTACVDGGFGLCEAEHICPVRGRWDPVNAAIRTALSAITVAEIATPRPFFMPLPVAAAE